MGEIFVSGSVSRGCHEVNVVVAYWRRTGLITNPVRRNAIPSKLVQQVALESMIVLSSNS